MFHRRPSPALVISIISLVVALGGTSVAARHYLITNSSQIKNGVIKGADLRSGTITKKQLSTSVLSGAASAGTTSSDATTALEAHRQTGPQQGSGDKSADVVSLDLPAGVYAVFAKTVLTPDVNTSGLAQTLDNNKTEQGNCHLDVAGTGDFASGSLTSPSSSNALTLSTQLTRSLDAPGKAVLTCDSPVAWHAADSSIVALKVGSAPRTETP
jgi:hypothetical protein